MASLFCVPSLRTGWDKNGLRLKLVIIDGRTAVVRGSAYDPSHESGEERQLTMTAQSNTDRQSFRFRTTKGQWLTDEIAAIERLATERMNAGISLHSAQTGARVLLRGLLHDAPVELLTLSPESIRIQACPPPTESPRLAAPQG